MFTSGQSLPARRVLLLVVALISVALSPLVYGGWAAQADGAVVVDGIQCYVFDGDGSLVLVDGSSHRVSAPYPSGTVQYTCTASGVTAPAAGGAVEWNYENRGVECSTVFGPTKDWRQIVTPSGQVTLSCFINPSPSP